MILVSEEKIAQYTGRGWWGTQTFWDLFVANLRQRGDAEAVVDASNREEFAYGKPRRLSWTQLAAEVDRFCLLLIENNIRRDAIVVVHLPNCVEQFAVYLACARLGIVVTPVPVQYREHEIEHILSLTAVTANDVFSICWTSGTEAAPKGVPRSHNEWLIIAPSIIEAAGLQVHARLLNPFPFVNMSALSSALGAWLVLGGTVVQHHPFSLPVFLQQLRDELIDYTVAPPAILNLLLQNEALLQGIDFKRLSRIGSGSAPLSEWMVRGFAEKHGVQIVNYFGSNEGAALSGSDLDIPDPALRAQFFPRAGVDGFEWSISTTRKVKTRLVDLESGADITQVGQPGELRFSGPTVFSGYYRAPEMSQRAYDEQGFYKTGDLFEIAGDNLQYYRYVGRSKDLVIRGGMNISSEEIEGLLAACPGVREVAVVGVPDAILGEKLCACVVAAEGQPVSLQDLTVFLRDQQRIAVYKLPEYILHLPLLPRNPIGKILKRALREQAKALGTQAA